MGKAMIVVRVPETEINRLRELRDLLLESRDKGLLVIPADTEIEVMELPLGDVLVEPKEAFLLESQGGTNVNGH